MNKQIALVHVLCSLHNFSKNQRYNNDNSMMQWEDVCFPVPDGNGGNDLASGDHNWDKNCII